MGDIKVFISSVQREFERDRRQLCDYIRTDALLGQFFVPFIFEELPASEISAQKAYLTQTAACHIYLGIFGCNKQTFFVLFFVKLFVHFAERFRGSFVPVYT